MDIQKGFEKIVHVFEQEKIDYMIVGGFAMSFYNQYRFTTDINCVLQIYPFHIDLLVKHFPDWLPFVEGFKENASRGIVFNLTDFQTGVRYDFMMCLDTDYHYIAFDRKRKVDYGGISCYICSPEDLFISKLQWYDMGKSQKQLDDIKFLLKSISLDKSYIKSWVKHLKIKDYGLL